MLSFFAASFTNLLCVLTGKRSCLKTCKPFKQYVQGLKYIQDFSTQGYTTLYYCMYDNFLLVLLCIFFLHHYG